MRKTFWTTAELVAAGRSKASIRDAVACGALVRVRSGHYCLPEAHAEAVRAARVGGLLTGPSAGRALGLWTPPDGRLHVALPLGSSRLRDPDDASKAFCASRSTVLRWSERVPTVPTADRVAPVPLVLEHALRVLPAAWALAMIDSALQQRRLRAQDLAALRGRVPAHCRPTVDRADGSAESGLESIVRHLLVSAGLTVRTQVDLPGVGRVDLLVEGRLVVELDGRQWHGDFDRDRHRDAAAARARYRVMRFTYRQVMDDPAAVLQAVLAALSA